MQTEKTEEKENSGLVKKLRRSKSVALSLTLVTAMYFSPGCKRDQEPPSSQETRTNSVYEGSYPTSQPATPAEFKEQQRVYSSNPALWWALYGNKGYAIPGHPYYPGNPLYEGHVKPSGSSGVVSNSHSSGKSQNSPTKSVPRGGFGSSGKSTSS